MNIDIAIACHLIGDFPLQNVWFVTQKGKSWEVNFYHAAVYTAVFILFGALWWQALILLGTHFMIDPLKARWNIIKHCWQDQLLHLIVILALFVTTY